MAAEQSTTMVLKVDLQCSKCYKKVKKVLCKFPQIRDQEYDEKQNTATIKVVCCCSPEKLKQKIQCKGGKSIKSIVIKRPPPPLDQKPEPRSSPPPLDKTPKQSSPPPPDNPNPPPPQKPLPLCMPYIRATGYPPPYPCCRKCCVRHEGWPCYCGRGYCGRPVLYRWGSGCESYCRSRCTDYICEENPNAACSIM